MQDYFSFGKLQIANELYQFVETEALPDSQVSCDEFWQGFEKILQEFMPLNQSLLEKRETLQRQLDEFYLANRDYSLSQYKSFLKEIGYLEPIPDDFTISTKNVDQEIANMAGPQLVVPINNARYALNAANARWGSLYDAVYGSDIIAQEEDAKGDVGYNPARGQKVIEYARQWLDIIAPLKQGSHLNAKAYNLTAEGLTVSLDTNQTTLADPQQCIGFQGELASPSAILLKHNGLHVELQFDPTHPVAAQDPTGMKDILVESALTTIMDCEDSVTAVDAQDKTLVYRNWLGLMKGTLSTEVQKNGKTSQRLLAQDRIYKQLNQQQLTLSGRSLMFVRNVGHLMTSDAILYAGKAIPEGIMDAMLSALIGKHDLLRNGEFINSQTGSIYIVKPKMHGSEEVRFTNSLFDRVEQVLGLAPNTLKMGVMDEERRTSINLKACIEAAKQRIAFINTGFLDRTGDEIHTSMKLGPFTLKAELKTRPWIKAYEASNVATGLKAGLSGKAQIGKGMWPIPDNMAEMMASKQAHPQAGASTAWVPSPTAATLHALHYHQIDVFACQHALSEQQVDGLDDMLTVPLMDRDNPPNASAIAEDLDNNVQGILGYVVRWVHQGVGCSKVPDIHNVGLMEDRATLRISSQHIANWLEHNIVTATQVEQSLASMAELVDQQNKDDPDYIKMCPDFQQSFAFQAAHQLIFEGGQQPSGYTEPLLHQKRQEMKAHLTKAR